LECPNCGIHFHEEYKDDYIDEDTEGQWGIRSSICPSCGKLTMFLVKGIYEHHGETPYDAYWELESEIEKKMVKPQFRSIVNIPEEVPDDLTDLFKEACLTLNLSPKASAALSRRCLQHLLRDYADVNESSLYNEIQEVIDKNELPTYLKDSIDFIRNIGNYAAHPNKSENTGEIIKVEPGEAEWSIDVLRELFEFFFVRPENIKKRREKLNEKLQEMGKNEML